MAHVSYWVLLLSSLLLWSSSKLVRGPEAQFCKDRGSVEHSMVSFCILHREWRLWLLCGKERMSCFEVLQSNPFRHCLKDHSRSSLAVPLLCTEQQVREKGFLNQAGCRMSVVRKAAGSGYLSAHQPEHFILTHKEGLFSKCDLSKTRGERALCQQNQARTMQPDLQHV